MLREDPSSGAPLGADEKLAHVRDRVVMLGLGSIGQAVLPLLIRHLGLDPGKIDIIAADETGKDIAAALGVNFTIRRVDKANYRDVLDLRDGSFLINLSVGISSRALLQLCREKNAHYLDTCIEPWPGLYEDGGKSASKRSNYALRDDVLAMQPEAPEGPTAVITMGANPGLASAFVKEALLRMARDNAMSLERRPVRKAEWAALARALGISVIHVAERDTQVSSQRKRRGEFVNTWSVAGFIGEGLQPAELGWGTHERHWPDDAGRHDFGCGSAIYLNRSGANTRVRSWTPLEGPYLGYLVTHSESISLADYLTVREQGEAVYRPTVHYAYHPCDDAVLSLHELAGKGWDGQRTRRIMRDDIVSGMDELGVLLMGNAKGAYWFGSRLTIEEARRLVPYNSATSLQVAAGVLSGVVWALNNPRRGIVEPDDIPSEDILRVAGRYLGEMVGVYTDWTPLEGRERLFPEDLDHDDPWQFKNIRVC